MSDFTPRSPDRPPWHRSRLRHVEHAYTGVVAVVPLEIADRVQLHGLGSASDYRDELEPFDWTPAGWGVSSSPTGEQRPEGDSPS